jgi:hypothetical protein
VFRPSKPNEIAKLKKVLTKLHDYIEVLFPDLKGETPKGRYTKVRKEVAAMVENSPIQLNTDEPTSTE